MARVLVLENADSSERRLSVELLIRGYEVAATSDAKELFMRLEECADVDLVLVEAGVPGLDVKGLVRRLRAAFPEVRVAEQDAVRLSTTRDHLSGFGMASLSPTVGRASALLSFH